MGIFINGQEMKQCLFADDSTYFLQDIVSLRELKSTISVFSKYSSLNVNYEKSEANWIGPDKNNNDTPENLQWVNLSQKSIKILGIHFTYNNTLHQQNNFDRILQSSNSFEYVEMQTFNSIWKDYNS